MSVTTSNIARGFAAVIGAVLLSSVALGGAVAPAQAATTTASAVQHVR